MILRKSKYYWKGTSFCNASVVIEENEKVRDAVQCKTCQVGHWGLLLTPFLGFALDNCIFLWSENCSTGLQCIFRNNGKCIHCMQDPVLALLEIQVWSLCLLLFVFSCWGKSGITSQKPASV